MDARNVYASGDDTGNASLWNYNREANALTDREVFRIFRDGAKYSNTYRVEVGVWWLRSIYGSGNFLDVYGDGTLFNTGASYAIRVRPSVTDHF